MIVSENSIGILNKILASDSQEKFTVLKSASIANSFSAFQHRLSQTMPPGESTISFLLVILDDPL